MGRRLYVGNLPYETGENDLQDLFARAGTVETVKVMRDMSTGRARGFAFVEMSTDEEAQKAISELNDYQLGGRGLTVCPRLSQCCPRIRVRPTRSPGKSRTRYFACYRRTLLVWRSSRSTRGFAIATCAACSGNGK